MSVAPVARGTSLGNLLREWRAARRMSQLTLALEVGMSSRHLSFVETGRAKPSREMVLRLAEALGMPLRERNALLMAGGHAPQYPERALTTPALNRMQHAIELILAHQEPYPAFVLDRHWNVLTANQSAVRINHLLLNGRESRHTNLLRQIFDPDDFRAVVVNWVEVAEKFIRHAQEQITAFPSDHELQQLVAEVLHYPDVPDHWRLRDLDNGPAPLLTLTLRSVEGELRFFETITSFSMARDLTLDELRIECAFPADDHTAAVCARLAASES